LPTALEDPDSGDTYYANEVTGETTWDRPESHQDDDEGDGSHLEQESNTFIVQNEEESVSSSGHNNDDHNNSYNPQSLVSEEDGHNESCNLEQASSTDFNQSGQSSIEVDGDDESLPPGWYSAIDPDSNKRYYRNNETEEIRLGRPEFPVTDETSQGSSRHGDNHDESYNDDEDDVDDEVKATGEQAILDPSTGDYNEVTNETMESARSSAHPSIRQSFSITPAPRGRGLVNRTQQLLGGGGGYVTPRFTDKKVPNKHGDEDADEYKNEDEDEFLLCNPSLSPGMDSSVDFSNSNDSYGMPEDESITGVDSSIDFGNSNDSYDMPDDESITDASSKTKRKPLQNVANTSCDRASKVQKLATAEIVRPAPSTTTADASSHVHRYATAQIVPAPSTTAAHLSSQVHRLLDENEVPAPSEDSFPWQVALNQYDIRGNLKEEPLVVQLQKPSHHPLRTVNEDSEALVQSMVLELTRHGADKESIQKCCFLVHFMSRDLFEVIKSRLSHYVPADKFPQATGFLSPKEFTLYLCSLFEDGQQSYYPLLDMVQLEHKNARGNLCFEEFDLCMNELRARLHWSNTEWEERRMNGRKGVLNVFDDSMVPINEVGTQMTMNQFYSNGDDASSRFCHWYQQPRNDNDEFDGDMLFTVGRGNQLRYEKSKRIMKAIREDTGSKEFLRYCIDSFEELLKKTTFSADRMNAIYKKYAQRIIDLLEQEGRTVSTTASAITTAVSTNSNEPNESTLTAVPNEDIRLLVKRTERIYSEARSLPMVPWPPCLIFGHGDIGSRLIQIRVLFNAGKIDISMYEQALCQLAEILETRMACIEIAKNDKINKLEKKYKSARLCHSSLGDSIQALEDESNSRELTDEERIDEADETAALRAAADLALKEWKDESSGRKVTGSFSSLVPLSTAMNSAVRNMMYILACIRVMKMLPFHHLLSPCTYVIKGDEVDVSFVDNDVGKSAKAACQFLDETQRGWREAKYSVADALEHAILYLRKKNVSAKEKKSACGVVMLISRLLWHDNFTKYFKVAEVAPPNQVDGTYTEEKDLPVVTLKKSYFEGGDDPIKGGTRGTKRRNRCTKSGTDPIVFNFKCPNHSAEVAFGLSCVSANDFVNKSSFYSCLHDEKKQITPKVIDEVFIEVKRVGANSSKAFQKDFILLDLTKDLEEGTTQSLDRLKKFFGPGSV
jgi:hypothetical protein